jgi:hypothetical protein
MMTTKPVFSPFPSKKLTIINEDNQDNSSSIKENIHESFASPSSSFNFETETMESIVANPLSSMKMPYLPKQDLTRKRSLQASNVSSGPSAPKFRRSESDSHAFSSLPSSIHSPPRLDCEEVSILPHIEGNGDAIRRITPQTVSFTYTLYLHYMLLQYLYLQLARAFKGDYKHLYDDMYIIDCRFEYEFVGGHPVGAINICTQDQLEEKFISHPMTEKRTVLIFHCEYSSKRGPRMYDTERDTMVFEL